MNVLLMTVISISILKWEIFVNGVWQVSVQDILDFTGKYNAKEKLIKYQKIKKKLVYMWENVLCKLERHILHVIQMCIYICDM